MPIAAIAAGAICLATSVAELDAQARDEASEAVGNEVTFSRDIAPIIFENCATCHRPGGSGPFNLLSYEDVRKRARQIETVTGSGFMPPWLPAAEEFAFVGERRLDDEQRESIRSWVAHGSVEGDPGELPPLPKWTEGWQLGPPDLIITLPEPYTLTDRGPDVLRNFVIPIPVSSAKWVRAVEFRPDNVEVVHHSILQIDRSRSSRRLAERDPEQGFGGMSMGRSHPPDGHFLAWTPGKMPSAGSHDTAWRLEPDTDLVLQLHMVPSGKQESVQPSIGFHFSDSAPTRFPGIIVLRNDGIDIPPGESDYLIRDSMVMPVSVDVLGIYPHAHYLGKQMRVSADLPDGSRLSLLRIDEWDFNWQDDYEYLTPIHLPAGSRIVMEYKYDNSSANVRNPNNPPKRVQFGLESADEMAQLLLRVMPRTREDGDVLQRASLLELDLDFIAHAERWLEENPGDAAMLTELGATYFTRGDVESAIRCFEKALEIDDQHVVAQRNLGGVLGSQGRHAEAILRLENVIRMVPDDAVAHNSLGVSLAAIGEIETKRAIEAFRKAIELDPGYARPHSSLARMLGRRGEHAEAIEHLRSAAELEPQNAALAATVARALLSQGSKEEGVHWLRRALVVNPQQPQIRSVLASVLAADRQFDEALEQLEEAMRHAPDQPSLLSAAAWILATHPDAEERDPERALEMAERAVELAPRPIAGLFDTLAAAHASAGQFDKAVEAAERGVLIAQNQRDIRTASAIRSRIDLYRKRQPFSEAE